MRDKIDENGQYLPYPGTTVVAAMQDSDTEFWQAVYNQLNNSPSILQYYALLPCKSYHMTGFALDTLEDLPSHQDWARFMTDKIPFYTKLHEALSAQKIFPSIVFDLLSEANSLVLAVRLSEKQRLVIQALAESYGCEAGIPLCFHITLAYQYRSLTAEDHPKIIEELRPLRGILNGKKNTTLKQLKLCYFDDMTCFTPWNGSTNPFTSVSSHLYRFYKVLMDNLPSALSCHTARRP